jgi:peroxiredoxin
MVAVSSTMLPLGSPAPDFTLPDTDGTGDRSLSSFGGDALVVMFVCNHCPFVIHVADELARLGRDYESKGVDFVAISSNNAEKYPQDGPEKMRQEKAARGYTFPYLYDATQSTAKAYRAACTPDFYVFDAERRLTYRGQLDETRPGRGIAHGGDLRAALDAMLAGGSPAQAQTPSIGCNIKWIPGNEPSYFN